MKYLLIFLCFSISISAWSFEAFISKINGDVTINSKKANVGDPLKIGNIVEAKGAKSFFIVKYENGTTFIIKNGKLKVKKLDKKKSKVDIIKGIMSVSVIKNSEQKFSVATKNAVMGVRGTKFWISEDAEESYLCVCEGAVEVENKTHKELVSRNEDTHVKKNGKFTVTKAPTDMWKMAVMDLELLGVSVKPLEKGK